ncbi:retron St85 family RNA-directed DNA polymerase [Pseudoalteromonas agarivorans]|uniref:retron St85 family RNA-directed DNA polymerase n=1 Tax=Pseudoalteromonas agarivorans TaxID=176102 RepID=UPI00311FB612
MEIVKLLSEKSNLTESQISRILVNGSRKYKVYLIPKRSHGNRVIAHPAKQLKLLQKDFLKIVDFPYHECSMAYEKGTGIKKNAFAHSNNEFLLKMDLAEFFNSITPNIFWSTFSKHFNITPNRLDYYFVNNLIFWLKEGNKEVLSVGAPSSPKISNFCMYQFDEIVFQYCNESFITYTRYADDMTFSTNVREILFTIPSFVESLLFQLYGTAIAINYSKTVFSSKAHNRHVTGVTISNEGALSLGRKRKRYIKHLTHQFVTGVIDKENIAHLRGLLAFSNDIEPSFLSALDRKYGSGITTKIMEIK